MTKIPEGFSRIAPYIFADNVDQYIDQLVGAFDAIETGRTLRDDGEIANVQLRFHDASIMLSTANEMFPPSNCAMYFYVDDADEVMQRALATGMETVMGVADMPYGDRQGGVKDMSGNYWWISQRITDEPY